MLVNNLNPILFQSGFISVRWYGVFLALGILLSMMIIIKLLKKSNWTSEQTLDLSIWLIIGGLLGARLGEILFYEPLYYWQNPLEIFFINHGGLSSHGMTLGLLVIFFVYCYRKKYKPLRVADTLVVVIPLLATFIRLGNFFNSEIVGRVTSVPWGVYFMRYEQFPLLRHPVVLYEALATLVIFVFLYFVYKKYSAIWRSGSIFGLFLFVYFSTRFILEFFKEYQTSWENVLTAGQWLSLPFIIFSLVWGFWQMKLHRNNNIINS